MLISVVVPVYNTKKYLRRCLDSILGQTYCEFELLLIDDGSTDGSSIMCDEYADKDSRVKVFHKPNGGVSSARKFGLDKACGDWIAFVDSDDSIADNYLAVMGKDISSDVDLIITSTSINRYMEKDEYIKEMLMRRLPPQLWGKLYRKSALCGSLNLPRDIYWGEDLISNVLVGLNLQRKVLLKRVYLYNYDINDTSVSRNRLSSLEYEEYFLTVLKAKIGDINSKKYRDAINFTALYILEDMIVCKQKIDYNLNWIKDLVEWSNGQTLTVRQKIVLTIKNSFISRYLLALHRKLSVFKI